MKIIKWLCMFVSIIIIFPQIVWFPTNAVAQAPNSAPASGLRFITSLGKAVFFFEDGLDPNTGNPIPPPSQPLAPIAVSKIFEFEAADTTIPAKSLDKMLQIDLHLRQRYYYRNDGQNFFRATTHPIIEIESPALPNIWRFSFMGGGLHLSTWRNSLNEGEVGHDSRGNFGRQIITADTLDYRFGSGTSSEFFKNEIIIRIYIKNEVCGLYNYVAGAWAQIYGY